MSRVHTPVAFRCKNCGREHTAAHAGENLVPHSCSACGAGVQNVYSEANKGRVAEIIAKLSTAATPQAERDALVQELGSVPREKVYVNDNWEVLAEATPERLAELDLHAHHICAHKPEKVTRPKMGRVLAVGAKDGAVVNDGAA